MIAATNRIRAARRADAVSRRRFLVGGAAFAVMTVPQFAAASADIHLGYTRQQVFSAALRYLRIDLGYQVTEKNADAAYLLFEYVPHGKREPAFGAFEIIDTDDGVRLAVKLPTLPAYHENVLRDGLVRKLRAEYGTERPQKPTPKPEQKPKRPKKSDPPTPDDPAAPDDAAPVP